MDKRIVVKKLLSFDEVYLTGIRTFDPAHTILNDASRPFVPMRGDTGFWYADPVLFTHKTRSYLFTEAFDCRGRIGRIACTALQETDPVPRIVLQEPFHLSFPRVFSWNDAIFMIPETSADRSIRLYRAISFPDRWELVRRFETDVLYVDTVVTDVQADHVTLLLSEVDPRAQYTYRYRRLVVSAQDDDYTLTQENSFCRAQSFDHLSRNAGALFEENGKTILPTQESSAVSYGLNLRFYAYDPEQTDITGALIKTVTPRDVCVAGCDHPIGIHSYTRNDAFEVIDVRYMAFDPRLYLNRLRAR